MEFFANFWFNVECYKNHLLGHGYRFRTNFASVDEIMSDRGVLRSYHGEGCSLSDILSDPLSIYPLTHEDMRMLWGGTHPLGIAPKGINKKKFET
jgi:hypothetical protein